MQHAVCMWPYKLCICMRGCTNPNNYVYNFNLATSWRHESNDDLHLYMIYMLYTQILTLTHTNIGPDQINSKTQYRCFMMYTLYQFFFVAKFLKIKYNVLCQGFYTKYMEFFFIHHQMKFLGRQVSILKLVKISLAQLVIEKMA